MTEQTHTKVNIKNNFFDTITSKWPIVMAFFTLAISLAGLFFRVSTSEAQISENKSDIRDLTTRVNSVEGDIKAIREGVDFLKQRAQ
jgi:cell division protein FtsB